MKQEKSKYTVYWYLVLILLGAWAGLLAGVAVDGAVDKSGRIDITLLKTPDFASIDVYKKLFDEESNAKSGSLIGGFVVFLVIVNSVVNRKRLHRKGEEHGSAKWAGFAEKKKLADKGTIVGKKKGFYLAFKFGFPVIKYGEYSIRKAFIYKELEVVESASTTATGDKENADKTEKARESKPKKGKTKKVKETKQEQTP
jgi:hypothetical protein